MYTHAETWFKMNHKWRRNLQGRRKQTSISFDKVRTCFIILYFMCVRIIPYSHHLLPSTRSLLERMWDGQDVRWLILSTGEIFFKTWSLNQASIKSKSNDVNKAHCGLAYLKQIVPYIACRLISSHKVFPYWTPILQPRTKTRTITV